MSNCVDIYEPLRIPNGVVDVEGLSALVERGNAVSRDDALPGKVWTDEVVAYWYLSRNVYFDGDYVTIYLGQCRSSHTFRDLKYTLSLLSKFIKGPLTMSLLAADEYDGFKERYLLPLDLKEGRIAGMS